MLNGFPAFTLYTIGHSNQPTSEFLGLLQRHAIQALVDVRSAPYSRFAPQFNRKALEAAVREAGMTYHYAGDSLGGRPTDPGCYKSGRLPEGKADYAQAVDYAAVMTKPFFLAGIERLVEIAQASRTAIVCSEGDPGRCHRHFLIGQFLSGRGVTVLHIQRDGNLISDAALRSLAEKPPNGQIPLL